MLGSLISAGASLLGGVLGRKSTAKANKENIANQEEFAKNSIRWRVEDAKAAGVHPVYALGAPTMSFAPSSVGDTSMPTALAGMGQDIGRAVNATRTGQEKFDATVRALSVTKMGLENDLLSAQIAQINQGGRQPNFPGGATLVEGQGDVPEVRMVPPTQITHTREPGGNVQRTQKMSDAEVYESRYGDLVQELYGVRNWLWDNYPGAMERMRKFNVPYPWSGK